MEKLKKDPETYCCKIGQRYWLACDSYVGPAKLNKSFSVGTGGLPYWRTFDLPVAIKHTKGKFVILHVDFFEAEELKK